MEKLQKLGKYELGRELGRGAMGVVYEAFDPQIERTVAIKTILKSSVEKQGLIETFDRFRREARAAGRLSHPKIVSIYEYGEDEEMAFIVMELINGKELKDFFEQQAHFSIAESVRIVLQLLDALDYSHSRGVVHRDIKPANILMTETGDIKIADFGIAKIDSSSMTQSGVVLGTPTYMSPEQFMGGEVDQRSDLYAAGVILYQCLTGERPFNGSIITIMHQAVNQEATPPSQLNPAVTPALDAVVKKAMAKKPDARFQNANEFMQTLKRAMQSPAASEKPALPEAKITQAPLVELDKTRLQRQVAALKEQAAKERAAAENKRAQEIAAQALRTQAVTASLTERGQQFAETMAERAAVRALERNLQLDTQRALETEVERKKRAKEERILRKESATLAQEAEIAELTAAQQAERIASQQALAEAKAQLERAEQQRQLAENAAQQEKQRTQRLVWLGAGLALVLGLLWLLVR